MAKQTLVKLSDLAAIAFVLTVVVVIFGVLFVLWIPFRYYYLFDLKRVKWKLDCQKKKLTKLDEGQKNYDDEYRKLKQLEGQYYSMLEAVEFRPKDLLGSLK